MSKSPPSFSFTEAGFPMDIEHVNAIANSLADLTQRTLALRGYL